MSKTKITLFALFLICTSVSFGQTNNAAPYCTPVFGSTNCGCGISSVNYGTINATAMSSNVYTFYNNLPALVVSATGTYCYSVTFGGGTGNKLSFLVDYNQNNVFDIDVEPGYFNERVQTWSLANGGTIAFCGYLSDTALAGTTRARFMWVSESDPCQGQITPYSGEIEDYIISFTNRKAIPRVTNAINITGSKARLQGTVNINGGGATTVDIEYGQTTSYTNSVSGGSVTATGHAPIFADITGLSPATIYHYRVKATNPNGTMYSRDTTFVTTTGSGISTGSINVASIYPNPGKGLVHIEGIPSGELFDVLIYDITGKKVLDEKMPSDKILHLESLDKGSYFLKLVNTQNKETMVNKLMLY